MTNKLCTKVTKMLYINIAFSKNKIVNKASSDIIAKTELSRLYLLNRLLIYFVRINDLVFFFQSIETQMFFRDDIFLKN